MDFFGLDRLFPGVLFVLPIAVMTTLSMRRALRSDGSVVIEPNPDPVIDRFVVHVILGPLVWAPTTEELLFRAPLIVLFPEATPLAWVAAVTSGIISARVHGGRKNGFTSLAVLARLPICWVLPAVALWTHSIIACVAMHFAINLLATIVQVLWHNLVRRHPNRYPRLAAFDRRMEERLIHETSSS